MIIYAAVVAQLEVKGWTQPVKDMMVTEELATLTLTLTLTLPLTRTLTLTLDMR